ncbi:hypothetical protein OP10G_2651 [Fimbriimonas ginsengisoli Gsoil 348]|uniref:Uncharacterized protein n=1 Tax=Fimbriimonas ginsengisoli Gsoil 348 TaxID=661478 RepID=A0A068NWQ5_FIMGI|nr:hypothetical protein OP10G_2651 [Fimbriimonas ginsengisoli Gsoil 348]
MLDCFSCNFPIMVNKVACKGYYAARNTAKVVGKGRPRR